MSIYFKWKRLKVYIAISVCFMLLLPGTSFAADGNLKRRIGLRSCSFKSTVKKVDNNKSCGWEAPSTYFSPTFDLLVTSDKPTGSTWTTTARYELETTDAYPLQVQSRFSKYLEPGYDIQSDDPEIIALAKSLVAGCRWESDAVEKIMLWVVANIRYDDDSDLQDAVSVLHSGRAVCYGFSNLTIALLRAAGIPSDFAGGLMVLHSGSKLSPFFNGHAWVNVYYPSAGWVYSDPTWQHINVIPVFHTNGWQYRDYNSYPIVDRTSCANLTTIESEEPFFLPGESTASVVVASVIHRNPRQELAPIVHFEMCASKEPTTTPQLRAWVTASRKTAWCSLTLDDTEIASGSPSYLRAVDRLFTAALSKKPYGSYKLGVIVEDVEGRKSSAYMKLTKKGPADMRKVKPDLKTNVKAASKR